MLIENISMEEEDSLARLHLKVNTQRRCDGWQELRAANATFERKGRVSVGLTVNNTRILQAAKNNSMDNLVSFHYITEAVRTLLSC